MTTTKAKVTSFGIVCPMCLQEDSTVTIDLNNLSACTCTSCEEEFDPRYAVQRLAVALAGWRKVVRWLDMAGEAMVSDAE